MNGYTFPDWLKRVLDNYEKEIHKNDIVCECECKVISEEPVPIEEDNHV